MTKFNYPQYEADLELLGLKDNFARDELNKAFRKLGFLHHPDITKKDDKKFTEIAAARDRLTKKLDAETKAESVDSILEWAIVLIQFILLIKYFYKNPSFIPRDFFQAYQTQSFAHMINRMNADAKAKIDGTAVVVASDIKMRR